MSDYCLGIINQVCDNCEDFNAFVDKLSNQALIEYTHPHLFNSKKEMIKPFKTCPYCGYKLRFSDENRRYSLLIKTVKKTG